MSCVSNYTWNYNQRQPYDGTRDNPTHLSTCLEPWSSPEKAGTTLMPAAISALHHFEPKKPSLRA